MTLSAYSGKAMCESEVKDAYKRRNGYDICEMGDTSA